MGIAISQSQIKKKYPIIGNIISLGQNLSQVEWKTLSISNTDQKKLYSVLKSEFVDINDVICDFSIGSIRTISNMIPKKINLGTNML